MSCSNAQSANRPNAVDANTSSSLTRRHPVVRLRTLIVLENRHADLSEESICFGVDYRETRVSVGPHRVPSRDPVTRLASSVRPSFMNVNRPIAGSAHAADTAGASSSRNRRSRRCVEHNVGSGGNHFMPAQIARAGAGSSSAQRYENPKFASTTRTGSHARSKLLSPVKVRFRRCWQTSDGPLGEGKLL